MTESELLKIVDVSSEEGVIETSEKEMINNVVDFGDAVAKDIMIPRADMMCVDVNSTYDEIMELVAKLRGLVLLSHNHNLVRMRKRTLVFNLFDSIC